MHPTVQARLADLHVQGLLAHAARARLIDQARRGGPAPAAPGALAGARALAGALLAGLVAAASGLLAK